MTKNTLEFFVKMKDMMSGGLTKIAQTAKSTSVKVQAAATNIQNSLDNAFNAATAAVNKYTSALKNAFTAQSSLTKGAGKKKSGGMAGWGDLSLAGLATRFIGPVAIGAALFGGASAAIGGGMRGEQDLVGLSTFLGKQGAASAYANIRKDAAATPFDTASLLMVNRALISAGVSADEARKDTMNLANAIAAVGAGNDELGRMAANMQQIKTVGKATAMDIRQFAMTGINIYEMLTRATGKNIEQVKEMDVSYQLLSSALANAAAQGGMYFGALDAQSKTTTGRWNTFKDTVSMALADLGTTMLPLINSALDIANSLLERIVGWFQGITFNTSEWSAYLQPAQQILTTVWGLLKGVGQFVWYILGGIVDWVKQSTLMQDIFWAIGKVVEGVASVVSWVVDKLKWLWDNVLRPILDGIDLLYKATKGLFTNGAVKVTHETKTTAIGAIAATAANNGGFSGISKSVTGANPNIGKDVAKEATSGGPRVINISGVKFTDKIEIHSTTIEEGLDDLENRLMNMFSRILNSSAAVQ